MAFSRIIVCLLIAGLFAGGLSAQTPVPGYLGKRVSLMYEPSFSVGYNTNFVQMDPGLYPRIRHGADIDFVVSRSHTVGLSYEYYRTGQRIFSPKTSQFVHGRISGHAVGGYVKFFPFNRKGNIAPLGPYTKVEYALLFYDLIDKDGDYFENGVAQKIDSYFTSAMILSLGHNVLLWDLMFLNYGAQGGFVVGMLNRTDPTNPTRFGPVLNDRLAAYFAFNLNLGMGILLF